METQMDPDPASTAPRMPACCLFLAPARRSLLPEDGDRQVPPA